MDATSTNAHIDCLPSPQVLPTPLPDPFLVATSPAMRASLGLSADACASEAFVRAFSGDLSVLGQAVAGQAVGRASTAETPSVRAWATPYAVSVFGQVRSYDSAPLPLDAPCAFPHTARRSSPNRRLQSPEHVPDLIELWRDLRRSPHLTPSAAATPTATAGPSLWASSTERTAAGALPRWAGVSCPWVGVSREGSST